MTGARRDRRWWRWGAYVGAAVVLAADGLLFAMLAVAVSKALQEMNTPPGDRLAGVIAGPVPAMIVCLLVAMAALRGAIAVRDRDTGARARRRGGWWWLAFTVASALTLVVAAQASTFAVMLVTGSASALREAVDGGGWVTMTLSVLLAALAWLGVHRSEAAR